MDDREYFVRHDVVVFDVVFHDIGKGIPKSAERYSRRNLVTLRLMIASMQT